MIALRRIGAFLAGLIVTWLPVGGVEMLVHVLYPPPAGMNMRDMAEVKKYVAALPATAMLLVLGGWLIGAIAGTFTAARIGRTRVVAYVLGALLVAAGIYNSVAIPQPAWFSIASIVIYVGGTLLGATLGAPSQQRAESRVAA